MDVNLLISVVLNVVLFIITVVLAMKGISLKGSLEVAEKKLRDIADLIKTIEDSYADKVITPTEAQAIRNKFMKVLEDP